jgi:hypothetical protein
MIMTRGRFTLKKFIAKQLFDEYNILTKEILNLLSVALFMPDEREHLANERRKNEIKDMLEKFDANKVIEDLHDRQLRYADDESIFFKFINIIEEGRNRMIKNNIGKFKIMYFTEYINIEKNRYKLEEEEEEEYFIRTFDTHESIIEVLLYLYRRTNYAKLFLEMFVYYEDYLWLLNEQKNIEKSIVEKYKEWLKQFKDLYPTDELIAMSFFAKDIDEILKILNLLAKYLKFKRENSKQIYIPSPLLHRRFRLFNLQSFLKDELYTALKKLKDSQKYFINSSSGNNENIKFILNSDYDVGDLIQEYGRDIALVKGSFFWREMVRLYPMLMHEIAHALIYYLRKNYKSDLESLVENLYFRPNRNIFVDDEVFFTRHDLRELMYDVFSDLVSFSLFRDSYILSFIAYGGLGYLFFNTFISSPILETDEYRFFTFENLYSDINFDPKRESAIIRLKILLELKETLKEKQRGRAWGELIDENLIKEIKIYLNDLFALYREDFSPLSFYLASEKQQKAINTIKSLIQSISRAMLLEMEKFDKILDPDNEPFLPIYRDTEEIESNERIEYYIKALNFIDEKEVMYKISVYRENDRTKLSIKKLKKENERRKIKESLLSLVWKNKIETLEKLRTLKIGVLEGSILRGYVNTFKYCEVFGDEIHLETDYINFVKSRKIFEDLRDDRKIFQDTIKEYLNNRNDIYKYFLLSDFTTFFLKRDLYLKDYSEVRLYNKAIEYTGFLDRHSILRNQNINMKNLGKRWLGLILVKFNTERKYAQGKRILYRTIFNIDKELKEDLKNLRDFIEKNLEFFSFSAGWEDFILTLNTDRLEEIFDIMHEIQKFEAIKRTETIIGYNTDRDKNNAEPPLQPSEKKDFITIMNIRFTKDYKNSFVFEDNQIPNIDGYIQYMFPGRFDSLITAQKSEKEIVDLIELILKSRNIYEYEEDKNRCNPLEVEDLVIKVFKSLGNKFVFEK